MKYTIIVPVYNVEPYLNKCLESLINQTYRNFEIIIVNDGSTDNSQIIIDNYKKKYSNYIKSYKKENGGLSDARNFGVKKASGDYLLFVDSDDYVDTFLLENLNNIINNNSNLDLISFNAQIVFPDNTYGRIHKKPSFVSLVGEKALEIFINNKQYFEPACFYAYNTNFWFKNNFEFSKGKYHEDFGLIPQIIMKAKKVYSIDYVGYFYNQTKNSITRNQNKEKKAKKAFDILYHFDILKDIADTTISNKHIKILFNSYLANTVINQIDNLDAENANLYIKNLKERNVFNLLLSNSILRKLKKIYLKIKYTNLFTQKRRKNEINK